MTIYSTGAELQVVTDLQRIKIAEARLYSLIILPVFKMYLNV